MADCMKFPDTVEEFMEQYKVTDYKQVYTNGTELVPIFRMKQWFERQSSVDAVHVVRCKDCKFRKDNCFCCSWQSIVGDNGFCNYGKRKE